MKKLDKFGGLKTGGNYLSNDEVQDLIKIQKALFEEEKLIATLKECERIWDRYSNDLSASWLCVPDKSSDIISQIKSSDFFTSLEDYAKKC